MVKEEDLLTPHLQVRKCPQLITSVHVSQAIPVISCQFILYFILPNKSINELDTLLHIQYYYLAYRLFVCLLQHVFVLVLCYNTEGYIHISTKYKLGGDNLSTLIP